MKTFGKGLITQGAKALRLVVALAMCALLLPGISANTAYADGTLTATEEFNHGTIAISASDAVDGTLTVGQGQTVTIVVTPYQHVQYEGCCYDTCPENCGTGDDCFVVGKGCKCGPDPIVRSAEVSVSVDDTSIATASDVVADVEISTDDAVSTTNNGIITITGVALGTTQVTVEADGLAFWFSASETYTIEVVESDADDDATDDDSATDGSTDATDDSSAGDDTSTDATDDSSAGSAGDDATGDSSDSDATDDTAADDTSSDATDDDAATDDSSTDASGGSADDDAVDDDTAAVEGDLDLGLYVSMSDGYETISTSMGLYPAGKVDFSLYPADEALATYQAALGDSTLTTKTMLQAWIDGITSVSLDGVALEGKDFDEWKDELTNAADDAAALLYYDFSVSSTRATLSLPAALFSTDHSANQLCTKTVVIESEGFADVTDDVTYRNLGSDSFTARVLDEDTGEVLYTCTLTDEQLQQLAVQERVSYTTNCGMAGLRSYTAEGVYLTDVLDACGVSFGEGMTLQLRVNDSLEENGDGTTTEDGYISNGELTYEEILGTQRYYYAAMWDDETTYEALDGRTVYSVLSEYGSSWDECDYTDALVQILGSTAVEVEPLIGFEWSEGVVGWGGSDTTQMDYSGYSDQSNYRFLFGMSLDEDGNATNEATTFSNVYALFGVDIIADESAIAEDATGTVTDTEDASSAIDISSATVTLSSTSKAYTGKAVKCGVKSVKLKVDGQTVTLVQGTDYTVSYSNNKAIGTATVTITGTGSYSGSVAKTFTIKPAKVTLKSVKAGKKGSKKLTVKWTTTAAGKKSGVKYQVAYKKKGAKGWSYKTVSAKTYSKVLKKLKKGKKYQVKVRAYKKVSGVTYYSAWSKTKAVKVK